MSGQLYFGCGGTKNPISRRTRSRLKNSPGTAWGMSFQKEYEFSLTCRTPPLGQRSEQKSRETLTFIIGPGQVVTPRFGVARQRLYLDKSIMGSTCFRKGIPLSGAGNSGARRPPVSVSRVAPKKTFFKKIRPRRANFLGESG